MSFTYWISKHERQNTKQSTRGMSTCRPRHLQLPLRPRTLLIADVTRLQPFTVGGDSFQENLETLVSYNVRNDGMQQDCLYIEQGHLMIPTTFMTYSMVINPRQSVVVTWTPIKMYSTPRAPSPHLDQDHPCLPPLKGLPVCSTCRIPPNRREAGSGHARWSSTRARLN